MKYLTPVARYIEDRRAPSSVEKPSIVIELTCQDCGDEFLIIAAMADTTSFSPCCAPCRKTRDHLVVFRYGTPEVEARKRDVMLRKGETPESFLASVPNYHRAVLYGPDGATKNTWVNGPDGWKVDKGF